MKKLNVLNNKITFAACGLDKENNFLQAPVCECGCGGLMNLILEDEETLYDFIAEMLSLQECNHCAIFMLHNDGKTVTVGDSDGVHITFISFSDVKTNANNTDLVKDWQSKFNFHCYGILEQLKDGKSYRIVME